MAQAPPFMEAYRSRSNVVYSQAMLAKWDPMLCDGERQMEGTDASRKRDTRSSAGHHKSEDTSDSREDDAAHRHLEEIQSKIIDSFSRCDERSFTEKMSEPKAKAVVLVCRPDSQS
ncbi:hypothetical protein NQZ68_026537 [Dissostichus eleginoides]|nr:hypothetical protein NQZ68_026537 [Dissostichus eleginoides]